MAPSKSPTLPALNGAVFAQFRPNHAKLHHKIAPTFPCFLWGKVGHIFQRQTILHQLIRRQPSPPPSPCIVSWLQLRFTARLCARTELKKAFFCGILAHFCCFLGYCAVNFRVTPGHLLILLPHPLFLWHISMLFGPFQTFFFVRLLFDGVHKTNILILRTYAQYI